MPAAAPFPPDIPATEGAWWGGPSGASAGSAAIDLGRHVPQGLQSGVLMGAQADVNVAGSTAHVDVAGLVLLALAGIIGLHFLGFRFASDVSVGR